MASTLIKVVLGLAGATTIGGGITTIYLTSRKTERKSNKEINKLFAQAKIKGLTNDETDNDKWKTKWTTFKSKYDKLKGNKAWKFDNWNDAKSKEDPSIQILKQKCTDNSLKKVVNENSQLFLEVKEFCTEPIANQ